MLFEKENITAIILSGGKSSRMGTDKGLVIFDGKPMVEHVINAVKDYCGETLIISNQIGYQRFGCTVHDDLVKDIGPIGGIYTGLTKSTTSVNIVLTCDAPLVDKELIERLIEEYDTSMDVLYCNYLDNKFPLTAIYSKSILTNIEKAIENEEYKVRSLFDKVKSKGMELNRVEFNKLSNINTPEDLKKIA